MSEKIQVTFKLPSALLDIVKVAAAKEGRPTRNYMRWVIAESVGFDLSTDDTEDANEENDA
jgi:predicted DNA binding CopG/RHH family protein